MKFRKLLAVILSIQLAAAPHSNAERIELDFGDDGSTITVGEDRGEQSEDGDCTGGGCGDDWNGRGGEYDDDQDGFISVDAGGHEADPRGDRDDRGTDDAGEFDRGGFNEDFRPDLNEKIRIIIPDRNNGMGFVVTDNKRRDYDRGRDGKDREWNDEIVKGDGVNRTDVYTNKAGEEFVKSTDQKFLLKIEGLSQCAEFGTCGQLGYREDWWNYSSQPSYRDENGDDEDDWIYTKDFFKTHLTIKNGIGKAQSNPLISKSPEKMIILSDAAALNYSSGIAYGNKQWDKARAYQEGAAQLASLVADIGLGLSPLGWAKDVYELTTGKGFVDGRVLTNTERIFAGLGVIAPAAGPLGMAGIKLVNRGIKAGKNAGVFGKISKLAEKVVVQTPFGPAVQDMSRAALEVKASITAETKLYRSGTMGKSMTGEKAQFWALEHPQTPGYASKYGIPDTNVAKPDFIEVGRIKEGVPFVTRPAPSVGKNGGGVIEVVVPEGGIKLDGHYTL